MERTPIRNLRILVVGKKAAQIHLLRMGLNLAGIANVVSEADSERAIDMLRGEYYDAVFCDDMADTVDGLTFPRAARKADAVLNPMVPIFLVYSRAGKSHVERARDDGVTNVLTMPVSAATLLRKLNLALAHPRPFIVASDFFGPDRRAGTRKVFLGRDRRVRIPRKVKVAVAGKQRAGTGDETLI